MNKFKAACLYAGIGGFLLLIYYFAILVTIGIYRRCHSLLDIIIAVGISMMIFMFIVVSSISIFPEIKKLIK